jgi:hypothetical protein
MEEHVVVMAVASYGSKTVASDDFDALWISAGASERPRAASVLEKGADGAIRMVRHDSKGASPTRGTELLGAALIVIAAPVGIVLLAPVAVTEDAWLRVADLVDRLWHGVPRDALHRMANLVEAGQATLVVVAVDVAAEAVGGLLRHASARIVTDHMDTDLAIEV